MTAKLTKEDPTISSVPCRVCAEPIREGARKCIHCDSFQHWRRYINFSSTVLALLVALASVSTVLAPMVGELLEDDVSSVTLTFHGVHENLFNLVATNTGVKDGVVAKETLHLKAEGGESVEFNLEPRFDQIVIYAGSTRQFTTRLNPLDFKDFRAWVAQHGTEGGWLEVQAYNFAAPAWSATFEVTASQLATINDYLADLERRFGPPPGS